MSNCNKKDVIGIVMIHILLVCKGVAIIYRGGGGCKKVDKSFIEFCDPLHCTSVCKSKTLPISWGRIFVTLPTHHGIGPVARRFNVMNYVILHCYCMLSAMCVS